MVVATTRIFPKICGTSPPGDRAICCAQYQEEEVGEVTDGAGPPVSGGTRVCDQQRDGGPTSGACV
jgi:hypothetical protein